MECMVIGLVHVSVRVDEEHTVHPSHNHSLVAMYDAPVEATSTHRGLIPAFVHLVCLISNCRIQNAVSNDQAIFALWVLHAISSPLQGFFNSVAFALDKETFSRLNLTQMRVRLTFHWISS